MPLRGENHHFVAMGSGAAKAPARRPGGPSSGSAAWGESQEITANNRGLYSFARRSMPPKGRMEPSQAAVPGKLFLTKTAAPRPPSWRKVMSSNKQRQTIEAVIYPPSCRHAARGKRRRPPSSWLGTPGIRALLASLPLPSGGGIQLPHLHSCLNRGTRQGLLPLLRRLQSLCQPAGSA